MPVERVAIERHGEIVEVDFTEDSETNDAGCCFRIVAIAGMAVDKWKAYFVEEIRAVLKAWFAVENLDLAGSAATT